MRNCESTIASTVQSVAEQTYSDVEHVIIDGASTDRTVEVVRSQNARLGTLISEPDRGVYDAFNKGLRAATGDVVAFLNAGDTYASSDVLERVAHEMEKRQLDVLYGDVQIVDPSDSRRILRTMSSRSFEPGRLTWGFMPPHPATFMRRSVHESCGFFDPTYRIAGDFEYCLRMFLEQRARYGHLPQVLTRMLHGGLSNRGWRSKWIITQEMYRACREHGIGTSMPRLLMRLPLKMLELTWFRRLRTRDSG